MSFIPSILFKELTKPVIPSPNLTGILIFKLANFWVASLKTWKPLLKFSDCGVISWISPIWLIALTILVTLLPKFSLILTLFKDPKASPALIKVCEKLSFTLIPLSRIKASDNSLMLFICSCVRSVSNVSFIVVISVSIITYLFFLFRKIVSLLVETSLP